MTKSILWVDLKNSVIVIHLEREDGFRHGYILSMSKVNDLEEIRLEDWIQGV